MGIWGFLFSIVVLRVFREVFVAGRIRRSGHLGMKLWISNTIPQVWVLQFFLQLLLFADMG